MGNGGTSDGVESRNTKRVGNVGLLLLAATLATGVVAMASLASARPGDQEARSGPVVRGCSAFDPAADRGPVQDLFDPESGKLTVETPDAIYVMYEKDDSCRVNPRTQRRLKEAREMADDAFKAMCENFRRLVAEGTTELNGRRVDLDAARRALEGRCAP